jgi:hypothetical protein
MQQSYEKFLRRKSQDINNYGFKPTFIPDYLFDFQKYLIEWSLIKGRGAIFADTGMGKTIMQLVWAKNIIRQTNKNILILSPLAVSNQTVLEGEKFGIEVKRSRDGQPKGKITITNYQQLEKFNHNDFIALICDESSILKNFEGQTKNNIVRFSNKMPYRLLCSATPSPNDFTEFGNSSEALGELRYMDMIDKFFRDTQNDKNPQWSTPKYELKKHAYHDFWKWIVSWARAIRKPSDLGFDDTIFILPKLIENEYILEVTKPLEGYLFPSKAVTLKEQRMEGKITIKERAEKVAELNSKYSLNVSWVNYDYEGDYLEKILPNCLQISGKDSDEEKEEKFNAFLKAQITNLIIKPKIGAFGLNWQHCNHTTFFPMHSYEQYYQGTRRFWRFGQKNNVIVDMVSTGGEGRILQNVKRKAKEADEKFSMIVKFMNDELKFNKEEIFNKKLEIAPWL